MSVTWATPADVHLDFPPAMKMSHTKEKQKSDIMTYDAPLRQHISYITRLVEKTKTLKQSYFCLISVSLEAR